MICFLIFSRILQDREACIEAALDTADLIASKSPIAVQGTKVSMVYSRDHTVAEGLDHIVSFCVKSLYAVQFFIIFSRLQIFSKFTFSKDFFRNIIRVSNGLDPDQAQHSVMPDLGLKLLAKIISKLQLLAGKEFTFLSRKYHQLIMSAAYIQMHPD